MDTNLEPGETVVKEAKANLMRGAESVGGKLFLTERRLVFESHGANVQTGAETIPVADIAGTAKVWTRVFGVLPLTPNSLEVTSRDGQARRFVVSGRGAWAEAIESAREGAGGGPPQT